MSCLCGDPACPSCGPAQGYCPKCSRAGKEECDCHESFEYMYENYFDDDLDSRPYWEEDADHEDT